MAIQRQNEHWSWKIAVLIAVPLLAVLVVLGWKFSTLPQDKYLTTAILIACGAVGWVIGTALSPDSTNEAKRISATWKGISLFASGYLVSKVDGAVTAVLHPDSLFSSSEHLIGFRLVAGLGCLFLSAILTYIIRIYGLTVGEK